MTLLRCIKLSPVEKTKSSNNHEMWYSHFCRMKVGTMLYGWPWEEVAYKKTAGKQIRVKSCVGAWKKKNKWAERDATRVRFRHTSSAGKTRAPPFAPPAVPRRKRRAEHSWPLQDHFKGKYVWCLFMQTWSFSCLIGEKKLIPLRWTDVHVCHSCN